MILLGIASLIYAATLAGLILGLRRLSRNRLLTFEKWPSISVIVPARNEAEVLERTLQSLLAQDYPGEWEIIVVDDRSTDQTPELLQRLSTEFPRIRPVRVTDRHPVSPKKNALAMGIRLARGELIATTDADCSYDKSWLAMMVSHLTPEVGVVAGLTIFDLPTDHAPRWQKIQWLDFFVQNFLAAGAAGAGLPSSCNGSNLVYRRRVYDEISGFGTAANVISGDDVLFTQRVSHLTKWKVVFSIEKATIVRSLPVVTIRELCQQRLRWASKGLTYRPSMMSFLFGIYAYYLMLLLSPFALYLYPTHAPLLCGILVWKFGWDYITVRQGAKIFGQQRLLPYFVPFSILQTAFYPAIGFAALLLPYRWKGDWYRTARLPRLLRHRIIKMRRSIRSRRTVTSDS